MSREVWEMRPSGWLYKGEETYLVGPTLRGGAYSATDARRIVTAVNSHDDLLAALEDLWAQGVGGEKSCGHPYTCVCVDAKVRAALAKARGQ